MTPEQLERAARHYCKLMGVDPEAILSHGAEPDERGMTPAIGYLSPRWKLVAKELHSFWAMNEALKEGIRDISYDVVAKPFPGAPGGTMFARNDDPEQGKETDAKSGLLAAIKLPLPNLTFDDRDEKGRRWEGGRGWVEKT